MHSECVAGTLTPRAGACSRLSLKAQQATDSLGLRRHRRRAASRGCTSQWLELRLQVHSVVVGPLDWFSSERVRVSAVSQLQPQPLSHVAHHSCTMNAGVSPPLRLSCTWSVTNSQGRSYHLLTPKSMSGSVGRSFPRLGPCILVGRRDRCLAHGVA